MAEAEIRIRTVDETGAGFQSVATRFEAFDQQVGNLEKNLKPLQEVLKAGVGASAALAGLGAAGKNAGNLAGAFSDLQSSFLGIKGAAESAGPALGSVGKAFEGLMNFGSGATKVFGGLMAAFEVGKQMKIAFMALNTIMAEARAIQAATAAATAATAAAQTTATASTGALTVATAAFNLVLSLNPIFLIGAAIAAAAAAIIGLTALTWKSTEAEEENRRAMLQSLETIRERNALNENARSKLEAYSDRLGLLSQKEKLTASEQEEVAETVKELTARYGSLGIEIEKTTGKLTDYAAAQRAIKQAMLKEEVADADAEIQALRREGAKLSKAYRDSKKGWLGGIGEGDEEIRQKIIENRKSISDAEKRRATAANLLTSLELEKQAQASKVRREAEEETAKIQQERLDFQNALEKEIRAETQTALEKELEALDERLKGREKELKALRDQHKISAAQYADELAQLKALGREREAQIRARHEAAEAEKREQMRKAQEQALAQQADKAKREKSALDAYAGRLDAQQAARDLAEKERKEEARLGAMDSQKALKLAKKGAEQADIDMDYARMEYRRLFRDAQKDGKLTDAEKAALDAKEAEWKEAARQRDRYTSMMKSARSRLDAGRQEAVEMAAAGPVESITRGSVEALRKEMQLGTKNPMLEAMEKAERKRDRQAKRQIELAEENNRIQKEKVTFKGV